MVKSGDKVDGYLDRIDHLPPAPMLVMELPGQFKQPDRDMDRMVESIAYDPALTAQLLKLCNSAFYGSGQPVESVFDAVMRIGFYEIYRMVAAVFGSQTMALSGVERALPVNELWKHAVTAAVAAETVAKQVNDDEATAFTAGLLHDIGKVILAVTASEIYAALQAEGTREGQTIIEAEKSMLGVDHTEVGGRLMSRWNLPTHLVVAAKCHHQPFPFNCGCVRPSCECDRVSVVWSIRNHSDRVQQSPRIPAYSGSCTGNLPLLISRTKGGLERSKPLMEM